MYAFFEYITNITYYLVFMSLVAVLAPSGSYKKYINLVMGIILVGIVILPLSGTRAGIPVTELFDGILAQPDFDGGDMAVMYNEQLTAIFHSQLHDQAERLLARNGFTLLESEWQSDLTEITAVRLLVAAEERSSASRPFIYVSPIRVSPINSRFGTDQPADQSGADRSGTDSSAEESSPDSPEVTLIKNLIADFYNIQHAHIYVTVE